MIRRLVTLVALVATPAMGADFSTGSEANSWSLTGEEKATFNARVTDAVCALTGDCPAGCGAGTRTMVLVREADDKTILVAKNLQTGFQGPTWDLAPFCGQTVQVDGLMVGDDPKLASKLYQVQRIKAGDGDWIKATGFTKPWEARNPDATGEGPWFRRDPQINERLKDTGYLGLGQEADDVFIAEEY
ncbi:hypothetical protein KHP62_10190 [Rhodobacteraceae bacterium NNCM2]|nr:hypothetical protein [Coraliihabitans acroporae]